MAQFHRPHSARRNGAERTQRDEAAGAHATRQRFRRARWDVRRVRSCRCRAAAPVMPRAAQEMPDVAALRGHRALFATRVWQHRRGLVNRQPLQRVRARLAGLVDRAAQRAPQQNGQGRQSVEQTSGAGDLVRLRRDVRQPLLSAKPSPEDVARCSGRVVQQV